MINLFIVTPMLVVAGDWSARELLLDQVTINVTVYVYRPEFRLAAHTVTLQCVCIRHRACM